VNRSGCESEANDLITLHELPLLGHLIPMILTSCDNYVSIRTLSFNFQVSACDGFTDYHVARW
jgi:hypothetical protein